MYRRYGVVWCGVAVLLEDFNQGIGGFTVVLDLTIWRGVVWSGGSPGRF